MTLLPSMVFVLQIFARQHFFPNIFAQSRKGVGTTVLGQDIRQRKYGYG
jgi:hypothetical protein